jgi:hypothetical protein
LPVGSHGYDEAAADRVRRTLEAVAAARPESPEPWAPAAADRPRLGESHDGRARWWMGAGAVGMAVAGLVAVIVLIGGTGAVDPIQPEEQPAADTFAAAPAAGPVNADVVVPGVVPEGFEYRGFRVLDPLPGPIEVDLYSDGDDVLAGFVTDDPATADRLAERTDLWGDVVLAGPIHARSDGFLGFSREDPAARNNADAGRLVDLLLAGGGAGEAAPAGYELAASTVTAELPEAGRLVQVDYGRRSGVLSLATMQGTLDATLAAHLYPGAQPATVRGQAGFAAADGDVLVWQEAPGLVAAVSGKGVDAAQLREFVDEVHVVSEDSWVALRTSADRDRSRQVDTPARSEGNGPLGGLAFRLEAFDRGSLAEGVASCRRLVVIDGGAEPAATRCGPLAPPAEIPVGSGRVLWSDTVDGSRIELLDQGGGVVDRVIVS